MNKIIECIKNPSYILYWLDCKRIITMDDAKYLQLKYKRRMGKILNLINPETFNEKLQWLKLYDRNPEYTKMVDKHLAKEYVAKKIGQEYIIPTIGIYDSFEEIKFDKLPEKFVIKCTHDSGSTFICKDKRIFDKTKVKKIISLSLKQNYYYLSREWPYKNVKPKIIVEEYIETSTDDLLDYKFMCFNGRVECSFICSERRSEQGLAVDFYDRDWNHMPFRRHYRNSNYKFEKPKNYDLMIELAEILSKEIPFVRVDFYEVQGKVYFGELTFYPGSGFEEFEPVSYDYILGNMIELPKKQDDHEK